MKFLLRSPIHLEGGVGKTRTRYNIKTSTIQNGLNYINLFLRSPAFHLFRNAPFLCHCVNPDINKYNTEYRIEIQEK